MALTHDHYSLALLVLRLGYGVRVLGALWSRQLHGNGDNGNTAVIRGNTAVVGTNISQFQPSSTDCLAVWAKIRQKRPSLWP